MDAFDPISNLRLEICELVYSSHEGHLLSSLSCLDAIFVLFEEYMSMKLDSSPPFILSKGHAALSLYVVLKEFGFLSKNELTEFANSKSRLGGHPDALKLPEAIASTGSLGHGLPITVGLASSNLANKYWCLMGDGELMEGTFWESIILIKSLSVSNLHLIIDFNDSHEMTISSEELRIILKSLNWDVDIINGHDHNELRTRLFIDSPLPKASLIRTVRGFGVKHIERKPEWHHKIPSEEDIQLIRNGFEK